VAAYIEQAADDGEDDYCSDGDDNAVIIIAVSF